MPAWAASTSSSATPTSVTATPATASALPIQPSERGVRRLPVAGGVTGWQPAGAWVRGGQRCSRRRLPVWAAGGWATRLGLRLRRGRSATMRSS